MTPFNRGFTLLEVLIAVAILGLAVVTLIGLRNRAIALVEEAERLDRAVLVASSILNEKELTGTISNSTGRVDGYRWEMAVKDSSVAGMKEVRLTLWWGDEPLFEVVEYVER